MAVTPKPVRKEMKTLEKGHREVGKMNAEMKEHHKKQDKKTHKGFSKFVAETRLKADKNKGKK